MSNSKVMPAYWWTYGDRISLRAADTGKQKSCYYDKSKLFRVCLFLNMIWSPLRLRAIFVLFMFCILQQDCLSALYINSTKFSDPARKTDFFIVFLFI
jgi:hypothetical protein